jgi:5-methylcytosine-specific restriction endonuclease McrA
MAEIYLEKKDPVVKAERILTQKETKSLKHVARHTDKIPAHVLHQVHVRDRGQCTHETKGKRCETKRWIDIHHIKPRSEGGEHTLANLTTLCSAHHRMEHSGIGV